MVKFGTLNCASLSPYGSSNLLCNMYGGFFSPHLSIMPHVIFFIANSRTRINSTQRNSSGVCPINTHRVAMCPLDVWLFRSGKITHVLSCARESSLKSLTITINVSWVMINGAFVRTSTTYFDMRCFRCETKTKSF